MAAGRSLDDIGRSLSWWDLKVILKHLLPDSAFKSQVDPDGRWKTPPMMLMVKLIDAVNGTDALWNSVMGIEPPESVKPKSAAEVRANLERVKAAATAS